MHFVVIRRAGAGWDESRSLREQPAWQPHADYMDALMEEGFVVLAGPLSDGSGTHRALLVLDADSEDQVHARLAEDPWTPMEVLVTESAYRWDVLLGALR